MRNSGSFFWKFLLWVIFFALLRMVVAQENTELIGKIERVDGLTGEVEIKLFRKKNISTGNFFLVLDSGKKVGHYREKSQRLQGGHLISVGAVENPSTILFAGMSLRLIRTKSQGFQGDGKPHPTKFWDTDVPKIHSKDNVEMVHIPAGKFQFGSSLVGTLHYTHRNENQPGKDFADIAGFYLDKYEVSREKFSIFLRETNTPFTVEWRESNLHLPADKVTYTQAQAYCKWAGKRLPSEFEWEKAARGPLPQLFAGAILPSSSKYADMGDGSKCNTRYSGLGLMPVHGVHDVSPFHVVGMCGNAAEWTSSWLLPYRGNTMPNEKFGRKYKVIRGGSFELDRKFAQVYERMAGGIPTLSKDHRAGFRCALSMQ